MYLLQYAYQLDRTDFS